MVYLFLCNKFCPQVIGKTHDCILLFISVSRALSRKYIEYNGSKPILCLVMWSIGNWSALQVHHEGWFVIGTCCASFSLFGTVTISSMQLLLHLHKRIPKLHYITISLRGWQLMWRNGTIALWVVPVWVEIQWSRWIIAKLPKYNRFFLLLPEQHRQCFF